MQPWILKSQLLVAIEYNNLGAAEKILRDTQFDPDVGFKIGSNNYLPAICISVERGLWEMTKLLINNGCSVNAVDDSGYSPLHFASNYQHLELVSLLLNNRANVNAVTNYGHTPLHLAAQQASLEIILTLVDGGANLDKKDCEGRTALAWSCICNQTRVADLLIAKGANTNSSDNCDNTPLLHCVNAGLCLNYTLVDALLENNADPNHVNVYGQTALTTAIRRSSDHCLEGVETVKSLVDHKCDLDAEDPYGETPLHLAITRDQSHIIEVLIRAGCDLERRSPHGLTPIYRLARENSVYLVKLLLASGAKWTPLPECITDAQLLRSLNNQELRDVIEEAGHFPKLQHQCRVRIRKTLGRNADRTLKQLTLPKTLKSYLLLKDC